MNWPKWIEHSQKAKHYKSQLQGVKLLGHGEVISNIPVEVEGRSTLHIAVKDTGIVWIAYGPRDFEVGKKLRMFDYRIYGQWRQDFVPVEAVIEERKKRRKS